MKSMSNSKPSSRAGDLDRSIVAFGGGLAGSDGRSEPVAFVFGTCLPLPLPLPLSFPFSENQGGGKAGCFGMTTGGADDGFADDRGFFQDQGDETPVSKKLWGCEEPTCGVCPESEASLLLVSPQFDANVTMPASVAVEPERSGRFRRQRSLAQ